MKRIKEKIIKLLVPLIYYFFRVFPIKNNKIFISNYYGKGYGDIPKYIAEELIKEKKYDIVWSIIDEKYANNIPKGIRIVKNPSIRSIYEQVTAKVWIDNCRKRLYVRKRKKQFYIQTWHGGFMIKKIEKSVEKKLPRDYVLGAINDSKMADLFISNSNYLSKIFKRDFWYNGEILECGCPRNDIIYNNNTSIIKKVYKYYSLDENDNICLYAPTFRNNGSVDAYNIDFYSLKSSLEKKFGGKWKILIRMHPNVSNKSNKFIKYNNDFINASGYDDIQELLVASNFMITDYSSCIFDYCISLKKCCLYASDINDYLKERGFEIDIFNLPFTISTNNYELEENILNFNENTHKNNVKSFLKKYGFLDDGNGAKTVANFIDKYLINQERKS